MQPVANAGQSHFPLGIQIEESIRLLSASPFVNCCLTIGSLSHWEVNEALFLSFFFWFCFVLSVVQSLCIVVSNSTLNRNNGKILLVEWPGLSFCNTRVKTCLSFRLLAVYRVADTNPSARTLNISFSVPFAFSSVGARGIWTITVGSAVASHLVFKIVLLQRVFWGLALEKGWIVALNYEVWEQLQTGSGPAPLLLSEQCFCAVPSHCTNDRSGLLLDWLVLIPFREGVWKL